MSTLCLILWNDIVQYLAAAIRKPFGILFQFSSVKASVLVDWQQGEGIYVTWM